MSKEIREEVQKCYLAIKRAQAKLKILRDTCKHEETTECVYEYRVGATFPAVVCSDCGELILDTTQYQIPREECFEGSNKKIGHYR